MVVRSLLRIVILVTAALAIASVVNAVRGNGIGWYVDRQTIYPPSVPPPPKHSASREDVVEAMRTGVLIIDARHADNYDNGHIPTAVSFPAHSAFDHLEELYGLADPLQPIIVYCGGAECNESKEVFELLEGGGFENVRIYFGGWRDWVDHNMPIEEQVP
jgi:3-mercaptopyruvate sulfurtransferase SseA